MLGQLATASSCHPYIPYYKKYSAVYIGESFPYQLFAGQAYTESHCRFVISYDGVGSESPAQITYRWWRGYLKSYGVYNVRTIPNFTKAQVLIMRSLIDKAQAKGYDQLAVAFQAYNGGWLVLKELDRCDTKDVKEARECCRRKIIYFKNGTSRAACDINYNYPNEIEEATNRFYGGFDDATTTWRMW